MLKERPYELNQKLKRIQASRDNLKANNREKVLQNKKLRDRNVEITESRDMWRSRTKELEKALDDQRRDLTTQIQAANEKIEEEKQRVENEKKQADFLRVEIEEIKKKSRS